MRPLAAHHHRHSRREEQGGAFLQQCVPNTCEGQAVDCDCIQGCSGTCATFGFAETGITITCNTCPYDACP